MIKAAIIGGAAAAIIWFGLIVFAGWGFDPESWAPMNRFLFGASMLFFPALGAGLVAAVWETIEEDKFHD